MVSVPAMFPGTWTHAPLVTGPKFKVELVNVALEACQECFGLFHFVGKVMVGCGASSCLVVDLHTAALETLRLFE